MTSDRPTNGFTGEVTGSVRAGGYVLEPATKTGTRILIVDPRVPSCAEIRRALAQPEEELSEVAEALIPAEEAIKDAERVTSWLEPSRSSAPYWPATHSIAV